MSIKNFYKFLAVFLGYGLIIGGFLFFGDSLDPRVRVLDIIVSCLVFTKFALFSSTPLVDTDEPAQKRVGMLGIEMFSLNLFCILSIGLIILGIVNDIPFKYQLLGQLIFLFIAIVFRVLSIHSGEKVQQVFEKEQVTLEGKEAMRWEMDNLMDEVSLTSGLDSTITGKLKDIQESLRFITPSANPEAKMLDNQALQFIANIKIMLRNPSINQNRISEEIQRLEILLARRKKY